MTTTSTLGRGVLAGAAGTFTLALARAAARARSGSAPSSEPGDLVAAVGEATGAAAPGRGRALRHRLDAWGEVGTAVAGLTIGVAGSALRAAGWHPGALAGGAAAGAASMGLREGVMARAGVLEVPGGRGASLDGAWWARRAAPHAVFGVTLHATLSALESEHAPVRRDGLPPRRAGAVLMARSALLGVAAGSRSSLGVAAPVLARAVRGPDGTERPLAGVDMAQRAEVDLRAIAPRRRPRTASVLASVAAVTGEMVGDKLPAAPSRLEGGGLGARLVAGAAGATALCRERDATSFWPAVAGAGGALAGARGGAAWRSAAGRWMPDWQAGLVEDGLALTLAAAATLGGRRPERTVPRGRPRPHSSPATPDVRWRRPAGVRRGAPHAW